MSNLVILLCTFIKWNVWYSWSLIILTIKRWLLVNFLKIYSTAILWWVHQKPSNLKQALNFIWEQPSKHCIAEFTAIFVCVLLSWSRRYSWNEVATSLARNFNNGWPLHLTFSNIINLCQNIWFIKNSKCQHFFIWIRRCQKKHKFFIFLKGCYFVMGSPIDMNVGEFWETSVGFLKVWICYFSQNTAKVMSTWMSKVGQNSTAFKK